VIIGRAAALAAAAGLLAPALGGCDVLLISPTLPGLLPGFGQPLRGQVLDSATGQPIGAATVISDIGWATTDNNGRFSLFGSVSRQNISVCRAGYTSVTYDTGAVQDDRAYFIDPLFPTPTSGELTTRRVEMQGVVEGPAGVPVDGEVIFAGALAGSVKDSKWAIPDSTTQLPGAVFSGVIAAGEVAGGPVVPAKGAQAQAFSFKDYGNGTLGFGYGYFDVPFGPTGSLASYQWKAPTPIKIGTFGTKARIAYTNAGWVNDVKTEITLDFGILGSIPVARAFSTQQTLLVPSVAKSAYILEGRAFSADRKRESLVVITSNTAQDNVFELLSPPDPIGPARGAKGVGGRPSFEWQPVREAEAYMVQVFEPNIPQPKWRGLTRQTRMAYPGFGDGDVNGGALLPSTVYTWEIHALSSKYGGVTPKAVDFGDFLPASYHQGDLDVRLRTPADILGIKDGSPPFRPFRKKTFQSKTTGMEFTR